MSQPGQGRATTRWQMPDWVIWLVALAGPAAVTAVLLGFSHQVQRDYVFIYLGLVAVVGVLRGLWPAVMCAAISFLLVDYFFVPPFGTLTIADEQDIVNLFAFLVIAGVVGLLASRRRRALLESQALAGGRPPGRPARRPGAEKQRGGGGGA